MNTKEAIMSFSQSEKVKAGVIWLSQLAEIHGGLDESEGRGVERAMKTILNMLLQEVRLAAHTSGDREWPEVELSVDRAGVMIESGVARESVMHLTQALSRVTNVGHRSMSLLREEGLL
jgi:hypothetical protein